MKGQFDRLTGLGLYYFCDQDGLKKSGLIVTVDEAEKILAFLRMLASIIIENYLKENSDNIGSEKITNCGLNPKRI